VAPYRAALYQFCTELGSVPSRYRATYLSMSVWDRARCTPAQPTFPVFPVQKKK